jgi:hypothetical protein
MNHDQIVLELDDNVLSLLLSPQFGKSSCWSSLGFFLTDKEPEDLTAEQIKLLIQAYSHTISENVRGIVNGLGADVRFRNKEVIEWLREVKKDFYFDYNRFMRYFNRLNSPKLNLKKTLEYPLIKGDGIYKCTKGFIDLIVHAKPITEGPFSTFKNSRQVQEFCIEIKTEKDFGDFGAILRQVKEYREYYKTCQSWSSKLTDNLDYRYDSKQTIFCVLSTFIPSKIKDLFFNEGILCLEIGQLVGVQNEPGQGRG